MIYIYIFFKCQNVGRGTMQNALVQFRASGNADHVPQEASLTLTVPEVAVGVQKVRKVYFKYNTFH